MLGPCYNQMQFRLGQFEKVKTLPKNDPTICDDVWYNMSNQSQVKYCPAEISFRSIAGAIVSAALASLPPISCRKITDIIAEVREKSKESKNATSQKAQTA